MVNFASSKLIAIWVNVLEINYVDMESTAFLLEHIKALLKIDVPIIKQHNNMQPAAE